MSNCHQQIAVPKRAQLSKARSHKKHSGFTLIEMLIGIIILGAAISLLSMSINQSVKQQEKMDALLDVYRAALTVKPQINAQLESGHRTGVIEQSDLSISWQANLLEEKREAAILNPETGSSQSANRLVKLYQVDVLVENAAARRAFSFKYAQKELKQSPFDLRGL